MIKNPDNQGDQSDQECAELNEIRPCNHFATPSLCKGAKEVFHPQIELGGTAYRGTGGTVDSIAQIAADCKKSFQAAPAFSLGRPDFLRLIQLPWRRQ